MGFFPSSIHCENLVRTPGVKTHNSVGPRWLGPPGVFSCELLSTAQAPLLQHWFSCQLRFSVCLSVSPMWGQLASLTDLRRVIDFSVIQFVTFWQDGGATSKLLRCQIRNWQSSGAYILKVDQIKGCDSQNECMTCGPEHCATQHLPNAFDHKAPFFMYYLSTCPGTGVLRNLLGGTPSPDAALAGEIASCFSKVWLSAQAPGRPSVGHPMKPGNTVPFAAKGRAVGVCAPSACWAQVRAQLRVPGQLSFSVL